ncbi:P-loop NTPase fold protein [Amycolatopsis sp., V23-08]|uniref:P-loop NTPase fold protein n=1 Tax=Amycolatopsis heterodermiae TaxID=3110235 RepID=A0ABU5R7H2_9PSEU|nr:P-loop NTPase fold protein [Amycolatopsis sp., V23-08]MEA5361206.1 P-loop NTPase fold protein [Amycolatopsis sp., V23-08]
MSESATPPQHATVTLLGQGSEAAFYLALTDRPWELPADVVAVSVGGGFGDAAVAMQEQYPESEWDSVSLSSLTASSPALLELAPRDRGTQPRMVALATPRDPDQGNDPTAAAITASTAAILSAASASRATAVALPLFGTGRLGVPAAVSARAVLEGALTTRSSVSTIYLYSRSLDHGDVIHDAWAAREPVFSSVELAGGMTRDLVDPNESIPLERDHLGVKPYVSMLATVIAARDTPLPLSIGVFGEWGSGKSFFMGLLRGQVKALEGTPGHCGKIAQVGFNAWHYADANLWASLGDEIFRQLAEPARRTGEPEAEHQARLREGARLRDQLAAALEQRQQLTAVTERAEAEAAALKRKIGDAENDRRVRAGDLLRALRRSSTFRAQYDGLWRQLGVTDPAEQGRLLADEVRGTLDEAAELRRTSMHRAGKGAIALAALVLLAGVCVSAFVPQVKEVLAGAVGLFTALTGVGLTLLSVARSGLRRLRTLADELRIGADGDAERERIALRKAEADQRLAEAQLEEVVARTGELGRQLAELTPGRRLYAFLAERSRGDDYRGNLGLISTIRKDFEKLVALMTAPVAPGDPARPMDRIVLYIDDLDRCSPQQVVDVLQAVHLLLAFDLFVVVVGVDPRWLLRSLSTHYDRLIEADAGTRPDGWHVTPEDYLEKILNIPLVLPRMPKGSLNRLLLSMVETARPAENREEPADRPEALVVDSPAAIPVEPGSQVAAQLDPKVRPEIPRPLTAPEIALLSRLDRLIDTPRDAKRLINLYRMLRSTRDLSDASAFLGGEYEAVVVLLATFTAHGRLLGRFADALLRRPAEASWPDFVGELRPFEVEGHWESPAVGVVPAVEVPQWEHLHHTLAELADAITLPDVGVFQAWVPRVRRFSYVLSPGNR